MIVPITFESLTASCGSITVGWVEAGVLHARFEGAISTELGVQFAQRFCAIVADLEPVRLFIDSSAVTTYDVVAFAAVFDALRQKREQLQLIVCRRWAGLLGRPAAVFAEVLGCVEYVMAPEPFDVKLRAAAPHAAMLLQAVASSPFLRQSFQPVAAAPVLRVPIGQDSSSISH